MSQVSRGDRLRIPAADWNDVQDLIGRKRSGDGYSAPDGFLSPACVVLVKNDTGADLARFAAVKLGAPVSTTLATDPGTVSRRPFLSATTPGDAADPVGILLEAVPNGKSGRAAVAGVAVATVSVGSTGHAFAVPTVGSATLTSNNTFGPIRLLGTPAGTGSQTCAVLLAWVPPTTTDTAEFPWTYEPSEADPCVMEPATFATLAVTGIGVSISITPPA